MGQSGHGSNGNNELLHNFKNSGTGASPSDGLVSYLRYSLGGGGFNPSVEMESS